MKVAIFADDGIGGKTDAIVRVPAMADHAGEVEMERVSVARARA